MEEWKEYKLGEVCTELSDGLHKAPKFKIGGEYIFVNAKNIANGFIVDNDPTKKSTYEEFLKYASPLNDTTVLYSIDGTIGNVALYRGEKCILGKGACYMNPNPTVLDRMFLYYELHSPRFKSYIDRMSTGSTIKHISLKTMRGYTFTCPPVEIQKQISSVLQSLDDKIEINRRINDNLEQQGQALFEEYVMNLNKPRTQLLSDYALINPTRTIAKGRAARCIEMSSLPTKGTFPSDWTFKEYNGGMKFRNGDTIMARITPCLENGKTAYINFLDENEVAFGSTEYIVLSAHEGFCSELLYFLARYDDFVSYAVSHMNGSSGRQRVSGNDIANYVMPEISNETMDVVSEKLHGIMEVIKNNSLESRRLAEIRDALLPRLMSGDFKLEEVNM